MEPFSVTCETCRARLKVRAASAVGEIHACPRCGSMVHITPPSGWNQRDPAGKQVEAPSAPPSFAHIVSPSTEAADAFAAAVAVAAESASASTPGAMVTEAATLATDMPGVAPVAAGWASTKFLFWSIVTSATLCLGGVALTWFSSGHPRSNSASPVIAAATHGAADVPMVEPGLTAAPADADVVRPDAAPSAPVEDIAEKPKSTPTGQENVNELPEGLPLQGSVMATAAATPNPDPQSRAGPAQSPTGPATDTAVNVPSSEMPRADQQRRTPVLRFDPLNFDPSQLTLATNVGSAAPPVAHSMADEAAADADPTMPSSVDEPNDDGLSPPAAESPSITVRLGPVVPAEPRPIAQSLAMRIDSITASDMSLERVVALVSDLSRVPITLDPLALELAGASPQTPVSVETSNATLQQLLRQVLLNQRLECVERNDRLDVVLADAAERSMKTHDVVDLVPPEASDAKPIAALIGRFVSPSSWQAGGGTGTIQVEGGKLRIEQTKAVHHEVVVFCERLRLARGISQRTHYPADRLAIDSPFRGLRPKLNHSTTFTFLPWSRLGDVVRHWQKESGITILVDWSRLADAGLSPATPIACSAIHEPWGNALQEILGTVGLAWWAVDPSTIQITTPDGRADVVRTEFYIITDTVRARFASSQALVASLISEPDPASSRRLATGEPTSADLDEPSRRLIVRARPRIHELIAARLEDAAGSRTETTSP